MLKQELQELVTVDDHMLVTAVVTAVVFFIAVAIHLLRDRVFGTDESTYKRPLINGIIDCAPAVTFVVGFGAFIITLFLWGDADRVAYEQADEEIREFLVDEGYKVEPGYFTHTHVKMLLDGQFLEPRALKDDKVVTTYVVFNDDNRLEVGDSENS